MTTIFKYSWGPILFEYFHYRCYNISTTFYKQCWYKYLCTICLILQHASKQWLQIITFVWKHEYEYRGNICFKILIRISGEYLFENINTNILGIFFSKYLRNICLKLNYSERWPRRLKRLERRGQRRSRSFVSPSRFFFLFACIWFGFLFSLCICNLVICYIFQTWEHGQRQSRSFV